MTILSIDMQDNKQFRKHLKIDKKSSFDEYVIQSFADIVLDAITDFGEPELYKKSRISGKAMRLAMNIVEQSTVGTLRNNDDKK